MAVNFVDLVSVARKAGFAVPLAAAGALPLLMASTALAAPDACVVGIGSIVCMGDQSQGIAATATPLQTTDTSLTVVGLTKDINAIVGTAGVQLTSAPGGTSVSGASLLVQFQDAKNIIGGAGVNGIVVKSTGTVGGVFSGSGLEGGNGGILSVTSNASLIDVGGVGISAVSQGGVGGAGQNGIPFPDGGNGGTGGNGGGVTVTQNGGTIITGDANAGGIVAASLGGAGGQGGNGATPFSPGPGGTGGDGGVGGAGGPVTVTNSATVMTLGDAAPGILARSSGGIGGLGGTGAAPNGGFATGADGAILGGGASGAVTVTNSGAVTTFGLGSHGVMAQSIAGAGLGTGAADYGTSAQLGRNSGDASSVIVQNSASIVTVGAGSAALVAQSIGNGGGYGGSALNVVGGNGGGGNGGAVAVTLSGASTINANGPGVVMQSIGGGGGLGAGTLAIQVGGSFGSGNGGAVTFTNNGASITATGTAIQAQSIGGGGGEGSSTGLGMAVGGFAVEAANGGTVTVSNTGAVTSSGGRGIVAQSIGGGGGLGFGSGPVSVGGFFATGNGADVTVTQSGGSVTSARTAILAQSIGAGGGLANFASGIGQVGAGSSLGNGGSVNVTVNGSGSALAPFTTSSTNNGSSAILAQSIGGGGGTLGGAATALKLGSDDSDGNGGAVTVTNNATNNVKTSGWNAYGVAGQSIGAGGGIGIAANGATVTFGGTAPGGGEFPVGSEGDGGTVKVTTSGLINTTGQGSHGLVAQSVGGGGGIQQNTGAETTFTYALSKGDGAGGAVTATNNSTITTTGASAFGVMAQSVGGGGGFGGTNSASGLRTTAGVGTGFAGSAGGAGNAGNVTVSNSIVQTSGLAAIGVFAQSVAGSGNAGTTTVNSAIINTVGDYASGIHARSESNSGNAGTVNVTSSIIDTGGEAALGIDARSISQTGNAGAVNITSSIVDTKGSGATGILGQSASGTGNANTVTIASAIVETAGSGAIAIHGQSTSNKGLAGDVIINSSIATTKGSGAIAILGQSVGSAGNAGAVTITSAVVDTFGATSNGIVGQSVTGATGQGGAVNITSNQWVVTRANGTSAIVAQSAGGAGNGNLTVVNNGVAIGGSGGIGVSLIDGATNTFTNNANGYVTTLSPLATALAVSGGTGDDTVNNNAGNPACPVHCDPRYNAGSLSGPFGPGIYGNIILGGGVNAINNNSGAYFAPGTTVSVGAGNLVTNLGTISPGDFYTQQTTTLTGNYVQETKAGSGNYLNDLFLNNNTADRIDISGTATLGGVTGASASRVTLSFNNPGWAAPGSYSLTILTAAGGRGGTTFDLLSTPPSAVFTPSLTYPNANTANLSYTIDFAPAGLTQNQASVGNAINNIQTAGVASFRNIAAQLFFIPTVNQLGITYDSLSGEGLTGVQQSLFFARNQFFDTIMAQGSLFDQRNSPWRVWVSGFGGGGHQNGVSAVGSARSDYTAVGGALGVDFMPNPNLLFGAVIGGGGNSFNVPHRSTSGNGSGFSIAAYGMAQLGAGVYVQGALSYGHYDTSTTRNNVGLNLQATDPWNYINPRLVPIALQRTHGSFGTDMFGGRFELGWRNQIGGLALTPFANIQFDSHSHGSFNEQGILGLRVNSRSVTSVPLMVGAQIDGTFPLGGAMSLTPKVRIAWVHEFETKRDLTSSFLAAPGFLFTTRGAPAVQDAARIDAGAQLNIMPGLAVSGNFAAQLSGRGTAIGGTGAVKWSW